MEGVTEPAQEVDHIIPLDDNSDREQLTDPRNLAPLCKSHHVNKTKSDGNPAELELYRLTINEAKRKYDYANATTTTS
ncbi:HNH endonuclease [Aeromonas allosaccharophila]|nr:HNH endonuclease [Aeromonas allosaccharophila]